MAALDGVAGAHPVYAVPESRTPVAPTVRDLMAVAGGALLRSDADLPYELACDVIVERSYFVSIVSSVFLVLLAAVAATKLKDSPVAGIPTVLVFPDLNTGNETHKAVQRSSGDAAIGPILQWLRKPVDDLSRGALLADIVSTVAITSIQATDP